MGWRDNGLIIHPTCPFVKHNCLRPGRFVYNYQKLNSRNIHIVRSAQEFLHCGEMAFMPSPPGGAPRSELKSNNCQWQLLHNVKVARASPASARRMRDLPLPLGEVPEAERAYFTLSVSFAASSPKGGAKGAFLRWFSGIKSAPLETPRGADGYSIAYRTKTISGVMSFRLFAPHMVMASDSSPPILSM